MALETGTYISDLNVANPAAADGLVDADNHFRLIKTLIKATFPNITGALTPTHTQLNFVAGVTSAIQTQLDLKETVANVALKANIASPTFTGVPAAPTAAPATNTTQLATTAFVAAAIAGVAVADDSITNAKLANVATATFKGRTTAGTGDPEDLTVTQATALLNVAAASLKGLCPAPSGSPVSSKYLAENMTYVAVPSTGSMTLLETLSPTSGSSIDSAAIPATYRDLRIEWDGVTTTGANGISVAASGDAGVNFGTAIALTPTTAGTIKQGNAIIKRYATTGNRWTASLSGFSINNDGTGTLLTAEQALIKNATGGSNAIDRLRFTSGGTFGSPTSIRIYGVL